MTLALPKLVVRDEIVPVRWMGEQGRFLLRKEDTGGLYTFMEITMPPGGGPLPAHPRRGGRGVSTGCAASARWADGRTGRAGRDSRGRRRPRGPMSTPKRVDVQEANKALARRWFHEGWELGDIDVADEIFHRAGRTGGASARRGPSTASFTGVRRSPT